MFKRKLKQSDYFLIAANLLPVAGVLAWGWSPREIFLVYCLETIIIGVFTLVKMGIVTVVRKTDTWTNGGSSTQQHGLFFMLFFLLHFGIFTGVQMGIFFGVSGIGKGAGISPFNFIYKWPELLSNDTMILLGAFVFCYGFKMLFDFLFTGEYRTISLMKLMFQPYGRIIIQQITVIAGSMFLLFGAGKIFIVIFSFVRIFFELYIDYDGIVNKSIKDMEKGSVGQS